MAQSSVPVAGMHVNVAGAGAPAVVFVHGFACDSADWAAQFEGLASRTTVVSCDLGSHGRSATGDRSIIAYGAAVTRLIDELHLESVILVGHSMGCRVVLECCRAASARVTGIVLLDGSRIGFGDPSAAAEAMAEQLEGAGYGEFIRRFFDAMFVPSSDPALHAAILERAMRMPPDVGRNLLTDIVRWDAGAMDDALSGIAVPVLVIQTTTMNQTRERVSMTSDGESAWLDLVRSHVPSVSVATLADAGHFPHIENARDVTVLIGGFVEEVAASAST
jgi:pimeloyl-ACP methyl ester carboxylesterase